MQIQDIHTRHKERHTALGLHFAIADHIDFLNGSDWDLVAEGQTVFLSRAYLRAIERFSPQNLEMRYVLIYQEMKPVLVLACQIAELSGEQFFEKHAEKKRGQLLGKVQQRMLVCGNLVSSGLHGVAFADGLDPELGWRAVAEALYRLRGGEKLAGKINFVMIKDVKGEQRKSSMILERYSYRPIKTDPDMVIQFEPECTTFEHYLGMLTSKYRSRIKKVRKELLESGFSIEPLTDLVDQDAQLHALYIEVEKRASVQLATLAPGYFSAMATALGARFRCTVLKKEGKIAGFIVTIKDYETGIAYYVGLNYKLNENHPIYFGLLQLSIEDALAMGCHKLSLGRTALEPKANHGAKPVETVVWMRHRVPLINFTLRKFFPIIPYDQAPQRSALKSEPKTEFEQA